MSIARDLAQLRVPVQVNTGGTGNNGTLTALASDVNWDTLTSPGEFFIPTASGSSRPVTTATTVNYIVEVINTPNGLKQTATLYGTPQTFSRSVSSGSWQAWYKTYDNNSIVGPVSQTGGVPTGAIIEQGSNANGSYIKYADGTMICHRRDSYSGWNISGAYGSMFNGQSVPAVSYPQAFISMPNTTHTMTAEGAVIITGSNGMPTITAWPSIFPLAAISYTGATVRVDRMAIGRWY